MLLGRGDFNAVRQQGGNESLVGIRTRIFFCSDRQIQKLKNSLEKYQKAKTANLKTHRYEMSELCNLN